MDKTFSTPNVQERDFSQPVISLGSHADNDIVLSDAGVLPFHATVVLEGERFRIIPAEAGAEIWVDGKALQGAFALFDGSEQIEIGNYALFFQNDGLTSDIHAIVYAGIDEEVPEEFLAEQDSEAILINMINGEADIEVEQSAFFEFEVVNAGPIVARFSVMLRGVPKDWVEISPSVMNLNEGRRQRVQVRITPPHEPESEAGTHVLQVVVTSPNYGRQRAIENITLTIQPFYEFALGSLSPRTQRIPWRKKKGITYLPISNRSNTPADFNLVAMDDEGGCSFDFLVEEDLQLNRQASVKLHPSESLEMPIQIMPLKHPMFAMRSKQFHYTTNVQIPQQLTAPQIVSGVVKRIPLFGWWSIVLGILTTVVALFFILQPNIRSFDVAAGKDVIELGDSTKLIWNVSPFATRLSLSNVEEPINRGQISQTVTPTENTTYELVSGNWLSGLAKWDKTEAITVLVVPPTPQVNVFEVDRTEISKGQMVRVRWSVSEADEVLLTIDEVVYPLSEEEYSGEREVLLEKDALVTLEAKNASGSELQSYFVNVEPPYININAFAVWVRPDDVAANPDSAEVVAESSGGKHFSPSNAPDPNFPVKYVEMVPEPESESGYRAQFNPNVREELQKGEQVVIEWNIDGTETLTIAELSKDSLPARGNQAAFPQESTNFTMNAQSGDLESIFMLPVKVYDGEPPEAPKIDFFEVSPDAITGPGEVEFSWSISGEWTYINISDANGIVADYLNPVGFAKLKIEESATLILTAYNGDLSSAKDVQVTVNPALRDLDITITEILPDVSYFRVGDSVDVFIEFTDPETGERPNPYPKEKVSISDGRAICTITLPQTTCKLTFNAAGTKTGDNGIRASYEGDDIYLSKDSEVFDDREIIVEANKLELNPTYYHLKQDGSKGSQINNLAAPSPTLTVGRGLFIDVAVIPINQPLEDDDDKGKITVRYCALVNDAVDRGDCVTVLPATVEVLAPDEGKAEIVIQNLKKVGNYALLIDYVHEDGAYDPVSLGGDGSISFEVKQGVLALIPEGIAPCDEDKCTLTQDQPEYIFNPYLVIDKSTDWLEVLHSTYIKPTKLAMKIVSQATPSNTEDWTDDCEWQKSGDHWNLDCKNVNLDDDVRLYYWFDSSTEDNYINYSPNLIGGGGLDITVKRSTEIVFPNRNNFLGGKHVGSMIFLQGGASSNIVLKEKDTANSTGSFIDGDIELTLKNKNGDGISNIAEYLIVSNSSSPTTNCTIQGSILTIKQKISSMSSDACTIAFKKAGDYTLNFEYKGTDEDLSNPNPPDVYYSGTIASRSLTVTKQEGVKAEWSPNGAYTWEIFSSHDIDLTFSCPSATTSCANFDDDVLTGATLQVDLSKAIGCKVKQGSTSLDDGKFTLSSTPETIAFRCTELGSKTFDLAFAGSSTNDFALASGNTQNATIGKMTNDFTAEVKINDNGIFANYPLADDREATPPPVWNNIQALYVGEEYWIVVTLSGMPSDDDIEPDSTDEIKMVWPSALDNAMENAKSTCDEKRDTNGVYYLPMERSADDDTIWIAKCKVRFSSTASLHSSDKITFSLPNSNRIDSANKEIALPDNGVIEDIVIIKTEFIEGYENKQDSLNNSYYTLSSPKIKITFDDNHYQADVGDDLDASMITATFEYTSGGRSTTLTCTKQTDGSFTCPLPDDKAWTDEISIRYDDGGATVFGVTNQDSATFRMVEIPVKIDIASIVWDDGGTERPFPQQMLYDGDVNANTPNSPADSPWYFIVDNTYTVRVKIVEDTGDAYAPVVNQGVFKIRFVPGSASEYNKTANDIVDGVADFTLNFAGGGRAGEEGKDYSKFTLTYTDDAFEDYTFTWDEEYIHRQNRITFDENWASNKKVTISLITTHLVDECLDVYIQSDSTLECEQENCWHLDDPNSNSTKEAMAVFCKDKDQDTWITGNTYKITWTGDGTIAFNTDVNRSNYQLYLVSDYYIGYNLDHWSP